MHDSEVVTMDNAIPPFTGNKLDYLIDNLIPRVWYASPSYVILIFYRGFIILKEFFLGSLANCFFILAPRRPKRKGSDPTDKFRGYLHGKASKSDSGMCSEVRDQRVGKFLSNFLIKPSEFLKKVHPIGSCEYVTTWGCAWSLEELVGSFLMKPPVILSILPWKTNYGNGESQKNFKRNRETETVFFLRNKQQFFYEIPPPNTNSSIFSSKTRPLLAYFDIQWRYAKKLPLQPNNCAKNRVFPLQNSLLALL